MVSRTNRPLAAAAALVAVLVVTLFAFAAPASASSSGHPKDSECTLSGPVDGPHDRREVAVCVRLVLYRSGGSNFTHATVEAQVSGYGGGAYSNIPVTVTATGSMRSVQQKGSSSTTNYGTKTGTNYDSLGRWNLVLDTTKNLRSRYRMYATEKVTLRWPSGYTKTVTLTSPGARVGY